MVRVRRLSCLLPVEVVEEICRPPVAESIPGLPAGVLGMAMVRAQAVPVVDLGLLLQSARSTGSRAVHVRTANGPILLVVDEVPGLVDADRQDLPPLLREACPHLLEGLAEGAADLRLLLNACRLLTEEEWRAVAEAAVT